MAGPAILKNHDVKVYVDYLTKLNNMIQSDEPINQEQLEQLKLDTWAVVGQFLKESEAYTQALEAAILAMPDLYPPE